MGNNTPQKKILNCVSKVSSQHKLPKPAFPQPQRFWDLSLELTQSHLKNI